MDQQEKQALPDVDAITTALQVADDGWAPVGVPYSESGFTQQQSCEIIAMPGRRIERSGIGRAIDLLNNAAAEVAKIQRAVRRRQPIELQFIKQDIDALIDEFATGSNALFWALTANRRMYHLSRRSVGCAVWALALGQRLGYDRGALRDLTLGALLLDIGKLNVPIVILAKGSKLNQSEQNFARRHVADSVRILELVDGLSPAIVEMVRSHHERIDGSGYPFGLQGDEISQFAKIAGIVDSFDALSLRRYYAEGRSGHAALRVLQDQRGQKFDGELIDQFVGAIGEFPTGTWVEFADGCSGIVGLQDPASPANPQVVLIADAQQQPFLAVRWLRLQKSSQVRVLSPAERPRHAAAMERSLQAAISGKQASKTKFS